MKVEEAKTKVCPFIPMFIHEDSVLIETFEPRNITCICGDCMAWEWVKTIDDKKAFFVDKYLSLDDFYKYEHLDGFDKYEFSRTGNREWITFIKYTQDEGYCKRLGQ